MQRSHREARVQDAAFRIILLGTAVFCANWALAEDQPSPVPAPSAQSEPAAETGTRSETVSRPDEPPAPPDRREIEVRPDDEGKIRFSFHGQPWLDVLEWLAHISDLSLDWQELPAGYLNLRTQQSYSKEEARDLINRHLLDRGFTLLKHGEILSVVNIKNLDPSLVPRLTPADLDRAQPHDFVRVSFALDWLVAESAVEEFKPLISPNGKLAALKATNRLEAIDAVSNLREIQRLLSEEQSPRGRKRLVREFRLEHVRAADVQPQLQKLLGLDRTGANPAQQPADAGAIVQQMAQILQRGTASGPAPPQKQQPQQQVQFVVDSRANTILAHAPPDQMAVIGEAIRAIDKPSDKSRSLIRNSHRVQVYPLAVAEPEAVIKMLNDLADLDPGTRLHVDKKRRALVAQAPLADHLTIRTLVEKVDGKSRQFRTIQLRHLDADFVAGSIDLVMGGGEASKRQPGAREGEDESRRFRTVADVENNRLLLWVNETELEEVRQLLAELGEPAAPAGADLVVRILQNVDPLRTAELLRRLQEVWPKVAPNPLEFGPGTRTQDATAPPKRDSRGARRDAPGSEPAPLKAAFRWQNASASDEPVRQARALRLTAERSERPVDGEATVAGELPEDTNDAADRPPVRIDRDSDGRLIIASEDAAALERMKKLVAEFFPPQTDFKVFRMKHKESSAYTIAENLKLYFDEKQKWERPAARFYDPAAAKSTSGARETDARKQSPRRQPKFIVDGDSNSILAIGADEEQLRQIGELVDVYDNGGSKEPKPTRLSRIIEIKNATARQIADTVKDVYRDLLTVEAPPPKNGEPQVRRPEATYTYAYSFSGNGGDVSETLVKFKGQLSIGVDESSNTVIVSAPEALLENVIETIEALDAISRASAPRIRVVKLSRDVHPAEFQKRLQRLLAKPQSSQSSSPSQTQQR